MLPLTPFSASPLLKAPLLVAGGILNYTSYVPPRRSPELAGRQGTDSDPLAPYKMGLVRLSGLILLGLPLIEAATIAAQHLPPTTLSDGILSILVPTAVTTAEPLPLTITPRFLVGSFVALAGVGLRLWSFRSLGSLFTYEVTLQKAHKLVTTGPYAYVRHPSYTGVSLIVIGSVVALLGPGSYLGEVGAWRSAAGRAVVSMCLGGWTCLCAMVFPKRAVKEDEMLQAEFGEAWEDWCRETPYRMIPYVW